MSSDSSENSAERAVTDRRVDDHFPRPGTVVSAKGFRAISQEEEANLLKRGIMTYYRGHLNSQCCEACDDALRTSDKYARGRKELRPVEIQKHKYIDKRRVGCARIKTSILPTDIQTGFTLIKEYDEEKIQKEHMKMVKDQAHTDLLYKFQIFLAPLNIAVVEPLNPDDVKALLYIILDSDVADMFHNYTPVNEDNVDNLKQYILYVIENVRTGLLSGFQFDQFSYDYAIIATIMLVMLEELSIKKGVKHHFISYLSSVSKIPFGLNFRKMVKELSKLPVYKHEAKRPPKVRFNESDVEDSKTNEEFIKKRQKMDTCPCAVSGKKMIDLYNVPTID